MAARRIACDTETVLKWQCRNSLDFAYKLLAGSENVAGWSPHQILPDCMHYEPLRLVWSYIWAIQQPYSELSIAGSRQFNRKGEATAVSRGLQYLNTRRTGGWSSIQELFRRLSLWESISLRKWTRLARARVEPHNLKKKKKKTRRSAVFQSWQCHSTTFAQE